MRKQYHRLTYDERKTMEKMYKNGCTHKDVSKKFDVTLATVYRDYKRGLDPDTNMYDALRAQKTVGM